MKKVIVMLCAAAVLCLTGCKKENPAPETGSSTSAPAPTPTPTPTPESNSEGLYNPNCKIIRIETAYNGTSEEWDWDDNNRLQSVLDGDGAVRSAFTYDEHGRVSSVTRYGNQLSGTMGVTYNGNYISRISLVNGGAEVVGASINHNSNQKISSATLNLSDNFLINMFNMMLAQYLTDSTGNSLAPEVDNVQAGMNIDWNDENVRQIRMDVGFRVKIMWGALKGVVSNLGAFGIDSTMIAYANALPDNTPIIFNITARDTANYTSYDDKVNPFRHYMGNLEKLLQLDASMFSANNAIAGTVSGTASIALSAEITIYGYTQEIPLTPTPLNRPLPSSVINNRYTYNSANYPVSVTNGEGISTTYTYAQ